MRREKIEARKVGREKWGKEKVGHKVGREKWGYKMSGAKRKVGQET